MSNKATIAAQAKRFIHSNREATAQAAKKPLEQMELGLPMNAPGFSKYDFYKEGAIINKTSGVPVSKKFVSKNVFCWYLTNDKGDRVRFYPAQLAELFRPIETYALIGEEAPAKYKKKQPKRKQYNRLTKKDIAKVLSMKGEVEAGLMTARKIALSYNVHESTIGRLLKGTTRVKSYFQAGK